MSEAIDIGQITEALNDKMDRDVGNPATLGKSRMSSFGMPSDTYEDLTLGASGTSYTATANGYVYLCLAISANGQIGLYNSTTGVCSDVNGKGSGGSAPKVFIPVQKGDTFIVGYQNMTSFDSFKFIYAVGSESEES